MKEKRLRKISFFESFYDKCESTFNNLRDNDKRSIVEDFENEYMLCVCPGSRAGGTEKRIVEVFWGKRPYEFETVGSSWKALVETGATLFFYRNDTGDISIYLYPAKTEFQQPIEKLIVLHRFINPKKLSKKGFIKSLWNDFIAYMACTSLDSKPTLLQRLRISYLRFFKRLVIDKKSRPTRFWNSIIYISKWIFTVGLSGMLIYFLTIIIQPNTTETEIQLKEINNNIKVLSKQLDRISSNNADIKKISKTVDSIEVKIRHSIKN